MNPIFIPELFFLISTNLNDEEKIFLTLCSKNTYNFKSLLILDLEYNLKEINDKWRVKHIIIKEFLPEEKIKELIKNLIPESITLRPNHVKFVSNNTNIKLFYNEKIIEKIVFYGYPYLAMKIMLNNDGSIENIDIQLVRASARGYLSVTKLLIEKGNNILAGDNSVIIYFNNDADNYKCRGGIIWTSSEEHLSGVKYLIKNYVNFHAKTKKSQALIWATDKEYLSTTKLLMELGVNIYFQNNEIIKCTIKHRHLDIIKLLKN